MPSEIQQLNEEYTAMRREEVRLLRKALGPDAIIRESIIGIPRQTPRNKVHFVKR